MNFTAKLGESLPSTDNYPLVVDENVKFKSFYKLRALEAPRTRNTVIKSGKKDLELGGLKSHRFSRISNALNTQEERQVRSGYGSMGNNPSVISTAKGSWLSTAANNSPINRTPRGFPDLHTTQSASNFSRIPKPPSKSNIPKRPNWACSLKLKETELKRGPGTKYEHKYQSTPKNTPTQQEVKHILQEISERKALNQLLGVGRDEQGKSVITTLPTLPPADMQALQTYYTTQSNNPGSTMYETAYKSTRNRGHKRVYSRGQLSYLRDPLVPDIKLSKVVGKITDMLGSIVKPEEMPISLQEALRNEVDVPVEMYKLRGETNLIERNLDNNALHKEIKDIYLPSSQFWLSKEEAELKTDLLLKKIKIKKIDDNQKKVNTYYNGLENELNTNIKSHSYNWKEPFKRNKTSSLKIFKNSLDFFRHKDISLKEVFDNKYLPQKPFEPEGAYDFIQTAKHGNLKIAQKLLKNNPFYVLSFDETNQTALHWAAKRNQHEMISLLIEAGSNTNALDVAGRTPLLIASKQGSVEAAKLLLANKADPFIASLNNVIPTRVSVQPKMNNLLTKGVLFHIQQRFTPQDKMDKLWKEAQHIFALEEDGKIKYQEYSF